MAELFQRRGAPALRHHPQRSAFAVRSYAAEAELKKSLLEDAAQLLKFIEEKKLGEPDLKAGETLLDRVQMLLARIQKLSPSDPEFGRKSKILRRRLSNAATFEFTFKERSPTGTLSSRRAGGTIGDELIRRRDPAAPAGGPVTSDEVLNFAKARLLGQRIARTALHRRLEIPAATGVAAALQTAERRPPSQPQAINATAEPPLVETSDEIIGDEAGDLTTTDTVIKVSGGSGQYEFKWVPVAANVEFNLDQIVVNENADVAVPTFSFTGSDLPDQGCIAVQLRCTVTDQADQTLSDDVVVTAVFSREFVQEFEGENVQQAPEPGPQVAARFPHVDANRSELEQLVEEMLPDRSRSQRAKFTEVLRAAGVETLDALRDTATDARPASVKEGRWLHQQLESRLEDDKDRAALFSADELDRLVKEAKKRG